MSTADSKGVALSTAILELPCEPAAAAAQLGQLAAGRLCSFALDPRLTPVEQLALAQALGAQGARVVELGHPLRSNGGRPAASPASCDRDERREARLQLADSLHHASELGGVPVVLYPSWLLLSITRAALRERFAWGRDLGLAALAKERAAAAVAAFDALCSVLDPLLNEALGLGVSLLLPTPAPWPHQLPDPDELGRLQEIFAGAPLQSYVFADWIHRTQVLGRAREAGSSQAEGSQPLALTHLAPHVRLADACGLTTQLPLGSGELDLSASGLGQLLEGRLAVLALSAGTTAAELGQSLSWLEQTAGDFEQR